MAERRVPRIRFKGFEEDWEQRKLGGLVERVTRKNENMESTLALTISAQYGLINQEEFFDKRIASKNIEGYFLIRKGEFAYNKSTSMDAPWGAVKRLDRYGKGVLSTLYILFRILNEQQVDSEYLVSYYCTNLWHTEVQKIAAEGARNHGLLNIAPNDFFEMKLAAPKELQEQTKIGSFLRDLDSLLSLHQRKLEKLKILKKAMLEKMFPKNGEKVPEIRFSGFADDWEQRKLEDFAAETRGGGTPATSNGTYWNGDIPWIQSSDLKEDELFEVKPRKYVSKIGLSKSATQLVEANSIAVVTRVGVGKLALMPHSYTTSQDFLSLSQLQVEPYFAVYSIYHLLQEELEVVQGTSIKGLTKEDLLSKSLLIPVDMGEQTQLGGLFYKLDSLISLHQRKLEKLRQIKKSMLERMFV